MEFVRSDWTPLAKKFQYDLFMRVFYKEGIDAWLKDFIKQLRQHELDDLLIYNKRLTKPASEYVKSMPPHVKAVRLLPESVQKDIRRVNYVVTHRGPMPIELEHRDIDYNHYVEKQLKPIADSVLNFLGKSFEGIVQGEQLSLF